MMVMRGLITRVLSTETTAEAFVAMRTILEKRGFKVTKEIIDPLGIEDHAWFVFQPTPEMAKYCSEVRLHMDYMLGGIEFEAKPLIMGQTSPAQREAFKQLTDDIVKAMKHKM